MKNIVKKIIVGSVITALFAGLCVCIPITIYNATMKDYSFSYTDDCTYEEMPEAYKKKNDKGGEIISFHYETSTYYQEKALENNNQESGSFDKYLTYQNQSLDKVIYAYLPYGYDEKDTTTKYDVLYHIHGTTCDGTTLIQGVGKDSETKNLLDNMIANGDMKPTIVVFPTWYNGNSIDKENPDYLIAHYQYELTNDVMPAVEKKLHTYASLTDSMSQSEMKKSFIDSREHRGIGGYSRGSSLTWYTFAENFEYFKWYAPMSGDYKCEFSKSTVESCNEKCAQLEKKITDKDYGKNDFFIYSSVGAIDFAYKGVRMQFQAMMKCHDVFQYGQNAKKGNYFLCTANGVWHTDTTSPLYYYNSLRVLFH